MGVSDWQIPADVTAVLANRTLSLEALAHADAIVTGEAENILPELLNDFASGQPLKRVYVGSPSDMTNIRGYSIENALDGKSIPALNLAYSRGCHFKCDFCAISQTQYSFRHRLVAHALADMDAAIAAGINYFVIPDVLMWGDREAAKMLLRGMAEREINWYGQASLDVVRNKELLDLIAESGCLVLGLGIESIRPESLKSVRKGHNKVEHYEESIAAHAWDMEEYAVQRLLCTKIATKHHKLNLKTH